jgi:hypothetical protein
LTIKISFDTENILFKLLTGKVGLTRTAPKIMIKDTYNLEVIPDPRFLHLRFSGVWGKDTVKPFVNEAVKIFFQSQHKLVLVDMRQQEQKSNPFNDYYSIQEMYQAKVFKARKIAVIDSLERKEDNDFFELIAQNHNINIRFFYSEDKAVRWLTEDSIT